MNYKDSYDSRVALIMGSEENGMRDINRKACDYLVSIPIRIESLNVSQACSVILSEIYSQRI